MKLNEAKEKAIFRKTVYIGEFFEGYNEKDLWIRLREPSTYEANSLREDSSVEEAGEVVRECIEDHTFEDEKGEKASTKDVYEFLIMSPQMFTKVLTEWQESLPLMKGTGQV